MSLQSTYESRKALLVENLETMGVTGYDETDGLTTLINAVLEIGPTPPTPTPASISLTGTKSILSYADSESSVLTATVLDDNDDPVEGVSVDLYKDSVLWDTLTTGSAGTVSKTYTSAGAGDVGFTAECGSLVTETYGVQDCLDYQPLTSNAHESRWTIPSGVTSVYDNTGWKATASSYKQIKLTDKLTNDCSVEFIVVDYSDTGDMAVIIFAYTNGETTPNQAILTAGSKWHTDWKVLGVSLDHNLIKGGVYRIEYTSSTLKVYENDVLLGSATNNVGLPTRFEFHTSSNRWAIYKDLKVKPL